jgi:hypothetical protein
VFRWLRHFRDENFFGDLHKEPSHPDAVRDLRKAPRERALVLRGVRKMSILPARRHFFRAASGLSSDDFFVLGRTSSTSEHSPSLILHVVDGKVAEAHSLDEPLSGLHMTPDGAMWGLSPAGAAIRFVDGRAKTFPLRRPTPGRAWWYGVGGVGDRVLAWGAGALLEFDGREFVPFSPEARLENDEAVLAVAAGGERRPEVARMARADSPKGRAIELAMLVCGDRLGAVARFDGKRWLPIGEEQVVEGMLADLDVWRGTTLVLARDGKLWRFDDGARAPSPWDLEQEAFFAEGGARRATHAVRAYDGGVLLASDGGVIAVGQGEPVFHASAVPSDGARLARVGEAEEMGIVGMCGPNVWIWRRRAFHVIDLRQW